jgi:NADPH:quinone reductase-like Zn-dependent oxidoreductase
MGHLWHEAALVRRELEALLRLYEEGAIRPQVDRVFPFEEAAAAHATLEAGENRGKVVLIP